MKIILLIIITILIVFFLYVLLPVLLRVIAFQITAGIKEANLTQKDRKNEKVGKR